MNVASYSILVYASGIRRVIPLTYTARKEHVKVPENVVYEQILGRCSRLLPTIDSTRCHDELLEWRRSQQKTFDIR